MPSPLTIPNEFRQNHTPLEDVQGLSIALLTASVGLVFLTHLGFLTGQTAGLALIISYVTGWAFGPVFFLVNLPFYALAWKRLGAEFTLKSMLCVTILSVTVDYLPLGLSFEHLNPVLGTAIFGVLTGYGLLGVFRHKGSLGGLGVIALLIQDRTGFRAGYVQLIVDAMLFAIAFFLFDTRTVGYSLFGALILNGVIAFNHRRDRYIAD
ncbi:YitT family protein [Pseudooceanicola sediminis]|uniref:YitT family protein n=1 Tax=Pseudooceanicola sediminis TaxID=2211117 RepID=A0A399JDB9_9RHOB|nr:YitT family protein [Pseudooceanicola sediminis]KAA2316921.1 YitT family protein [Puniceibacterium sp. HSS470]RII40626.1 YitT family protein [Pseudooceanicola sediminis]|tara:strand:+ start:70620 stop:71246 length:627 start_codon:yes stop_codon:yes gene_type:complete